MTDSCKLCKYWQKRSKINNTVLSSQPTKDNGNCLRYPPVPVLLAANGMLGNGISFPATEEDQWCGEFKPIDGMKETPQSVLEIRRVV